MKLFYQKPVQYKGSTNGYKHRFWHWEESKWTFFDGQSETENNGWTKEKFKLIYQTNQPVVLYDYDYRGTKVEGSIENLKKILPLQQTDEATTFISQAIADIELIKQEKLGKK